MQLNWALKGEPRRTDQWFWYELNLERWVLHGIQDDGREVPSEWMDISNELVAKYGPAYYNKDTRKAIADKKPLPDKERDRYRYRWHSADIVEMFPAMGDHTRELDYWRSASGWAHWSPITIFRAMDQGQGPFRYERSAPREAVQALTIAILCTLNTIWLVGYRFKLPYAETVQGFFDRLSDPLGKAEPD